MSQKPDIPRLIEFQKLLLTFSQIDRVIDRKHHDAYIRENDTEHSYNLALTAWYLAPYFPQLDSNSLIKFALAHDLVEVHAGDTYAFADKELIDSKAAREAEAVKQLKADWPDFPELHDVIHEYEQKTSEEAKFIYALDKIMPIMTIYISEGLTWKHEGLTLERLHAVKLHQIAVSEDIKPYYDALYELLLDSPHMLPKA
jgi:putative hydrolase of HD superfamily